MEYCHITYVYKTNRWKGPSNTNKCYPKVYRNIWTAQDWEKKMSNIVNGPMKCGCDILGIQGLEQRKVYFEISFNLHTHTS